MIVLDYSFKSQSLERHQTQDKNLAVQLSLPFCTQIVELCLLLLESNRTSNREAACILLGVLAPIVPENTERKADGKKTGKSSNKTKKQSLALQKEAPEWPRPIEVLSFLQQNDPSGEVREAARQALLGLGSEGQTALQQVQLSSHGFQGVDMKEKAREAKVSGKNG